MSKRKNIFAAIFAVELCCGVLAVQAQSITVGVGVSSSRNRDSLTVDNVTIGNGGDAPPRNGIVRTPSYRTSLYDRTGAAQTASSRNDDSAADADDSRYVPYEAPAKEVLRVSSGGEERYKVDNRGRIVRPGADETPASKSPGSSSLKAARAEGRKMWLDPQTMQMTVVDTPENLQQARDYTDSLTETPPGSRSHVYYLQQANAAATAAKLNRVLDQQQARSRPAGALPGRAPAGRAPAGNQTARVTKTLRAGDEMLFRELRLRLVRVDRNDAADDRDDDAQFVVRTPTASSNLTIEEFRSDFIDDYEINVLEINPSATRPGEGRVRLEVLLR